MAIPNFAATVLAALGTGGMDGALGIINDATRVVALSAEAANFTDANTNLGTGAGKKIAEVTVAAGDFAVTGTGLARKVTFAGKTGGAVTVTGPADPTVIAFLDVATSTILCQLSETGTATFATGGTVNFPAQDILTFGALS
jgi:hypothetical protein